MLRSSSPTQHVWKFFRRGGLDQAALESAEDLLALRELDEKLWVVLSCPVNGLELDPKTLELIDADGDGHIHVREVIAAIEWSAAHLTKPGDLLAPAASLPLAAINALIPEGQAVLGAAKRILASVGKSDATAISVEDTLDTAKILAAKAPNGDGVVTARATSEAATQALIKDIVACVGGVRSSAGDEGVDAKKTEEFFAAVKSYLETVDAAAAHRLPEFGEATISAHDALQAVRAKIDDFFARVRLAAFDRRAIAALNREETEYLAIAARDLSISASEIAAFPLARIDATATLPLLEHVNPAWAAALADFQRRVVAPLFGADKNTLTAEEWSAIAAKFAPLQAWLAGKSASPIEKLGAARAREVLTGPARQALADLLVQDRTLAPEYAAISSATRLVRYYRDLRTLLHNFVNFADFYSRDRLATFQAGTLLLDSRACELCLRVSDVARHADFATKSMACVAYLECRRVGSDTMRIAACFTQGDSDYLFVGRNGLFYDRQGRDWDATITKIIDNPISIRQAFWSPYKKLIRFIEDQVAKRATAAESATTADLEGVATTAVAAPGVKPAAPAAAPPKKFDVGTVAALGVGLGSIATAFGLVMAKFVELPTWKVPLVIVGLLFLISLPSMIIAWLKLRQRNLGPLLEANGWAINGRVKINIPFGAALTERAMLPRNARHLLRDPYAETHGLRNSILVVLILLALAAGGLGAAYRFDLWPFHRAAKNETAPAAATAPAATTNPPDSAAKK
ncbi:MAG TPA: hypothetical protein VHD62_05270 [Opitutaceae bacterium]|nr:hypothetical protein [Opitutaceae bacterium]